MESSNATPIRYFTLVPEDYDTITNWLKSNNLEYERFFASFINSLMITEFQRRPPGIRMTDYKDSKIEVFEEKDANGASQPVQALALIDAMDDHAKEYRKRGPSSGTAAIDLKEGRKGTGEDIEDAQRRLAQKLWPTIDEQKAFVRGHMHLRWLFPKAFWVPVPPPS